ncbi:unnamed protein product [Acanthoscelides obtectus]|uniref:Uncharacterized protein n=1 Tax=Acanthoscelides obtectus TaxID=200917 RepID=A0A9P0LIZ0_ACAOB|nr:unnamed protein product [Acanthoscelides obtectus]CAK1681974.1 hypothetical protein AOBTE_LOCUS33358 [Acanthoscelides obtectus]
MGALRTLYRATALAHIGRSGSPVDAVFQILPPKSVVVRSLVSCPGILLPGILLPGRFRRRLVQRHQHTHTHTLLPCAVPPPPLFQATSNP